MGDIDVTVAFLRTRGATGRVAGVGFCWGAVPVWKACGTLDLAPEIFACGASMHPSVHNCAGQAGEDANQIVSNIRCPQLVLSSSSEPQEWKPGGEVEATVRGLGGTIAAESKFQLFEERRHGWVTRGSFSEEGVERDFNAAINATVDFILYHFG